MIWYEIIIINKHKDKKMHSLLPEKKLTAEDLDPSHTKTIGTYVLGRENVM